MILQMIRTSAFGRTEFSVTTGRYLLENGDAHEPFMSTSVPGFEGAAPYRSHYVKVAESHNFSTTFITQATASINHSAFAAIPATIHPGLSISLLPEPRSLGQISVGGLPPIGHALQLPIDRRDTTLQLLDVTTYVMGRNTIEAGLDIRRHHMNGVADFASNGSYSFFLLATFLLATSGFL